MKTAILSLHLRRHEMTQSPQAKPSQQTLSPPLHSYIESLKLRESVTMNVLELTLVWQITHVLPFGQSRLQPCL